jgi:two-component system, OmpR family, response regulator
MGREHHERSIFKSARFASAEGRRRLLIIEDQRDLADLVALHLKDLHCRIDVAYDGPSGLARIYAGHYDLVVLDIMLPGVDGLEICRRLRAGSPYSLVLMVTARASDLDRVVGLELGADDYLAKPFSIQELVARAKALLRRLDALCEQKEASSEAGTVQAGDLMIDVVRREVTCEGRAIELTVKEFDLLLHFAKHPGRVFTRVQLLDIVWGTGFGGYEHNVNCHINRLRAKIEKNQAHPRYILTVRGVGYKFAEIRSGPAP